MLTGLLWPALNLERVGSNRPGDRGRAHRARRDVSVAPGMLNEKVRGDHLLS